MAQRVKKSPMKQLLTALASLKWASLGLFWLFVLTFWGTVAQVDLGLYDAQNKFFHSWFFMVWGFLPLPGGQLTLWVMFINLSAALVVRFKSMMKKPGLLIIHVGLMTYFVAAFVTFHAVRETQITVREGETTNLTQSYHEWEISLWPAVDEGEYRTVTVVDIAKLKKGEQIHFPKADLALTVDTFYRNATAFSRSGPNLDSTIINDSGIRQIIRKRVDREIERNLPGLIVTFRDAGDKAMKLILFGGEMDPTRLSLASGDWLIQLQRRRYELPFRIHLNDIVRDTHPGTDMARAYESTVTINHNGVERPVRIFMNNPFRFQDLTLYQASYAIDRNGREQSTFATVANYGRLLPYYSSGIVFIGLVWHFIAMGWKRTPRRRRQIKGEVQGC